MILPQTIPVTPTQSVTNWSIDTTPTVLKNIHHQEINIAIFEREINALASEISDLLAQDVAFSIDGTIGDILKGLSSTLPPEKYGLIFEDIEALLHAFKEVTNSNEIRLRLETVATNMCRKFHTDINDLRLLCTYSGPETLWLTDDNINPKAVDARSCEESVFLEEGRIQQAQTGAVVLLKGALYVDDNAKAVVHRSPSIEGDGQKRLLLRFDTSNTINIWK